MNWLERYCVDRHNQVKEWVYLIPLAFFAAGFVCFSLAILMKGSA